MKVAIFSDIHGNYEALKCIMDDIKKKNYDETIYLGDAIAIGPDSKKCLELLKNSDVKYILGNHELYFLNGIGISNMKPHQIEHQHWVASQLDESDKEFLKTCPLEYILETDGKKFKFSHFLLKNNTDDYPFKLIFELQKRETWFKYNKDYIGYFIGHEHQYYKYNVIKSDDAISNLILVGSSGCTKNDQTFYMELEIKGNSVLITRHFIKYNRQQFIEVMNSIDYPDKDHILKEFFGL